MKEIWIAQYQLVQSARSVLLDYCETVTPAHFVAENTGFGRGGSMRNLLVHIGSTYQYWAGEYALGRKMQFPANEHITTVNECRNFFRSIDSLIQEFIEHFADAYTTKLTSIRNNTTITTTPLEVFTHVITHEFHHKGQILSISRQLGYTPVDTDIIR